jgi:aryl-alcohol dehydrogenase-like predicted oxidoreductase
MNQRELSPKETTRGEMRYRPLGRTGEEVTSSAWAATTLAGRKARRIVSGSSAPPSMPASLYDNCWDYHDGGSEIRMGKALKDGYRKRIFLMTKIDGRTKEEAAQQIDQSLKRLQTDVIGTDVIDLLQFHEVIRVKDPDRIFAESGALEAVLQARKAGKIRFIGFT